MTFTKKEKQMFWNGIGLALFGSILGNLFTALWTDRLIRESSKFSWGNILLWIVFIVVFIVLVLFIWNIARTLKKVDKIKKGRPKRSQK